jgi:hypothetical protein
MAIPCCGEHVAVQHPASSACDDGGDSVSGYACEPPRFLLTPGSRPGCCQSSCGSIPSLFSNQTAYNIRWNGSEHTYKFPAHQCTYVRTTRMQLSKINYVFIFKIHTNKPTIVKNCSLLAYNLNSVIFTTQRCNYTTEGNKWS